MYLNRKRLRVIIITLNVLVRLGNCLCRKRKMFASDDAFGAISRRLLTF